MKKLFILFFLLINGFYCKAQDSISDNRASFDKKYFKSFLHDAKDLAVTPFQWKKKEWIYAASAVGIVALSYAADRSMRKIFQTNHDDEQDNIVNYFMNPLGNLYGYTFVASYYVHGVFVKDERSKKVAMETVKALAFNAIITRIAKKTFNRERPYQDSQFGVPEVDDEFNPFERDKGFESFFSGHTSSAFTIATVFAKEYKEKKWVPYVAYGLASSAGLARVYLDKHWTSDVIAGAIIGYYIGTVIHNENNWGIKIEPLTMSNIKGLRFLISVK